MSRSAARSHAIRPGTRIPIICYRDIHRGAPHITGDTDIADKKQQSQSSNTDENGRHNHKNPDAPNQGTVQHSDDGRLKENRDKGIHRGDKE